MERLYSRREVHTILLGSTFRPLFSSIPPALTFQTESGSYSCMKMSQALEVPQESLDCSQPSDTRYYHLSTRETRFSQLSEYLANIREDITYDEDVLEETHTFTETEKKDFSYYLPIYLAGQIAWLPKEMYGPSELVLFITHQAETNCSKDPNPTRNGFVGAMQRNPHYWSEADVDKAAESWSFLSSLPQRYRDDWKEIIWAAQFIRRHADNIKKSCPGISLEKSMLNALYEYCKPEYAALRVQKYERLRPLFDR